MTDLPLHQGTSAMATATIVAAPTLRGATAAHLIATGGATAAHLITTGGATAARLIATGGATAAPPIAPGGANLEPLARRFAGIDRAAAELLIDTYVTQAIREWRITDATFWQRVKFRSRLIRATSRRAV